MLFLGVDFMPHGFCMQWNTPLLTLHVVSDLVIMLAYFSIPFALLYFLRNRRDLGFKPIFICFALFICSCGLTHALSVWVLWYPDYWAEGWVKAFTATASIITAVILWRIMPVALNIPNPQQLQELNETLRKEIRDRKIAEDQLRLLNTELEVRVQQRTEELSVLNKEVIELQKSMLTICAWTKRIRDHGDWMSFEEFMNKHFNVTFSHGISEEGMRLLQKEVDQAMENPPPDPPSAN